ncbi:hypothetical protein M2139_002595 [Enterococcus sp. PF1-24]|uniref:hypothetical protein n=1 Tax=unclassified Enterococcus TaxID=2608891 RepID=UPI0024730D1B|nr:MULTISPECIES: hypothetical protein [unclassified Enterococcus]MDH6365594.1 hypothetical protein [Enterococcus sp. PFB1-1]MDH6402690.1 hypothetical protein [Enterococcus sp. PF1-24]
MLNFVATILQTLQLSNYFDSDSLSEGIEKMLNDDQKPEFGFAFQGVSEEETQQLIQLLERHFDEKFNS